MKGGKTSALLAHSGRYIANGARVPPDSYLSPLLSPPALDLNAHALFLDLDGTLVEFAAHPEQVIASDDLRALLATLARRMNGAVALITGRSIASADAVLDGVLVNVAGVHGLEHRGVGEGAPAARDMRAIVAAYHQAQDMIGTGALAAMLENKGAAFALHYRANPGARDAVRAAAAGIAERHALSIVEGNMVVELKLGERTKGDAVRDFMRAGPFVGRTPVAIGDDITDEDAFAAVRALDGIAVVVGERRPTAADFSLADTNAVFAWLRAGVEQ